MDNIVVLLWRTQIVPPGSQWARRAFLNIRQQSSGGIGFFTVLEKSCDVSTPPEVRSEIADLLKVYEDRLQAAAITFESNGFRATMVRSIITAIYVASRTRFPNSVFSDVQIAASWTSSHMRSSKVTASGLVSAVDQLRLL